MNKRRRVRAEGGGGFGQRADARACFGSRACFALLEKFSPLPSEFLARREFPSNFPLKFSPQIFPSNFSLKNSPIFPLDFSLVFSFLGNSSSPWKLEQLRLKFILGFSPQMAWGLLFVRGLVLCLAADRHVETKNTCFFGEFHCFFAVFDFSGKR